MPDEHRARPQAMTAQAALRWPRHPRTIGAADKSADCEHESIIHATSSNALLSVTCANLRRARMGA